MNVYLRENSQDLLPGDLLAQVILRSDLAPVPRTLELVVRIKNGIADRLKVGAFVWAGRENLKYKIVKCKQARSDLVQGADQLAVLEVTALLASCAAIAERAARPVIRDAGRLGDIYRASGASVVIGDDFTVTRFCCLSGGVPSYHIAQALQEEGSALVLRDGRMKITRLAELVAQAPKDEMGDTYDPVESDFLEKHEIPSFFSVNPSGAFVTGDYSAARPRLFMPRSDERVLRNASRVLVTRGVVDSKMAQTLQAGDVIRVAGSNFVIITAAHVFRQEEGVTEDSSRFWIGSLSK